MHLSILSPHYPDLHLIFSHPPYQDLSQCAGAHAVDELLGVGELNVHVQIHRNQAALVLGVAPFEADNDVLVDSVIPGKQLLYESMARSNDRASGEGAYKLWSSGRGLKGATV